MIRSSHSPIPLKEFIGRFYVDPSRGTASSGDDNNRKSSKSVKKELPWLVNDLKLKKARRNNEKRHVVVLDGNASSEDEEYVDDDGVVEDKIEALRARHLDDAPAALMFRDGFKIVATSDRTSRSHVEGDRSLDGLQAHAFGNEAIDFCKTQIIRESSSFDVSTYGAELAGLLARGWCDRMDYYFKIATEINDFACIFTAAQKAAFIESEEYSQSAMAEGRGVRVYRRFAQIRDISPS